MARSPTRRARPANPPATPPAIAAASGDVLLDSPTAAAFGDVLVDCVTISAFGDVLVDSGTVEIVCSAIWCPEVSVDALLWTKIDVVGVVEVTKLRRLPVEGGLILKSDGPVDV